MLIQVNFDPVQEMPKVGGGHSFKGGHFRETTVHFCCDILSKKISTSYSTFSRANYILVIPVLENIIESPIFSSLQAISTYSEALKSSEDDDACLVNRAIAYVMLGESDNAMDDFNKACEF